MTHDPAATERQITRAHEAFAVSATSSPADRAAWLRAAADALESVADDLIAIAQRETHLPQPRLRGELTRTTFQAQLFADRLDAGTLLETRHDDADPEWPMGPRPELHRTHVPLGPVLVFGASNFPFAFSVFGGDTVSALAVGCSVVAKGHPGHPELSRAVASTVAEAMHEAGAPDGLLVLVEGDEAGVQAIDDPRIKAVGFTGSTRVGRLLFDRAVARPEPIPFYGELGAVNPVVVTRTAWEQRGADVAQGFTDSFTLGSGQFCTKPGVVLVPDADAFVDALGVPEVGQMLNDRIREGYDDAVETMASHDALRRRTVVPGDETRPSVEVLTTDSASALADPDLVGTEMFGPAAVVVEYTDTDDALRLVDSLEGTLTASVQAGEDDPDAATVLEALARRAGRVVWNQWPTGVTVSDAQQHGGPWPATTAAGTTSVGTAAAYRFVRPVAFQGVPEWALPSWTRES